MKHERKRESENQILSADSSPDTLSNNSVRRRIRQRISEAFVLRSLGSIVELNISEDYVGQ
jgi:hypothetical protein